MDLFIDRLTINLPSGDRLHGSRIGQLVAEQLGPSLRLRPDVTSVDHLQLKLTARPNETADALARRIAERIAGLMGPNGAVEDGR